MPVGNPSIWRLMGAMMAFACVGGCAFVPQPLTDAERSLEARQDLAEVFSAQEPLKHALTLEEAFARAMSYNLDERVKLMQRQGAERDFEISKYDLLMMLNAATGAGVMIAPDDGFVIDRSLDATRFRAATGLQPPEWPEMIAALAAESPQYERWRTE